MKLSKHIILAAVLFCSICHAGNESAVLTGNQKDGKRSNFLPAGTTFIETGATFTWVKEGDHATDDETIKTSRNFKVLFDGNNGTNWKSRTYSKWRDGEWVTLVIDLQGTYKLSKVDVWRLHEKSRDTESVEILISDDGKEFASKGMAKDDEEVPFKAKTFLSLSKTFSKPLTARYVKLRIKKRKWAKQQQLGEIVLWGSK